MQNAQLGMLAREPRNFVRKSGKAFVDVVIRTNRTHNGGMIKSPHVINPNIATIIRFITPNVPAFSSVRQRCAWCPGLRLGAWTGWRLGEEAGTNRL